MKNVVVLGASGHAHVIADIIEASGDKVVAFLDDNTSIPGVTGSIFDYSKYDGCSFVIGIGNATVRKKLSNLPLTWYTAIHPSAIVSPSATIGSGSVVMPNAVINAGAKIGRHCIVNTSSVVEHDCALEDFVHVSVGTKLGGTVHVGQATWIGIGATVNNNTNICSECMVGAGTVVIDDLVEPGTYVGVPARKIK